MPKKRNNPKGKITTRRVQETEAKPFVSPTIEAKAEDDRDPIGDDNLTTRQRAFVAAYVAEAGCNATLAAEMAGYAAENRNSLMATASRLLSGAKIQEAIANAFAKRRESPEWAKSRLIDIAASNMAALIDEGPDGEFTLNLKKAKEAAALGQIREYKEEVIKSTGSVAVIKRTVKLHDPLPALQSLLKIHGKLIDRHEHNFKTDVLEPVLDDPESARLANALARRMANQPGVDGESSN